MKGILMQRRTIVFLVLLVSFTTVYSSAGFYLLSPRAFQPFMSFAILSEQGTLSGYVPGSGLTVPPNQTIGWHLEITNRMGAVQFVRVVFRIGNLTIANPNETSPASNVPSIGTFEKFIPDQYTDTLSFNWRVVSVVQTGGMVFPRVQINDQSPILSPVGAATGRDLRLMFELWTFDTATGTFQYGWKDGDVVFGDWLQVWFDLT